MALEDLVIELQTDLGFQIATLNRISEIDSEINILKAEQQAEYNDLPAIQADIDRVKGEIIDLLLNPPA